MEKSSFFNAELVGEEYDRVYLAEDYARYFASFIGNGVFVNPTNNLQVIANNVDMVITIKAGKAWINGYFYENTEDLAFNINVADGVLNRIDRVVVRLDFVNREIKTYIKQGTLASNPIAPSITRDADIYELAIADIAVNKGITKLSQSNITDLRQNAELCGIVKGTVDQIDTTNLFAQFQDIFEIWFEHVKGQLSTDAAGNLQNQIDTWNDFKANGGELGGMISLIKDWAGFMVSNATKSNQWYNYANPNGTNMIVAKPGEEHYNFSPTEFSPVWGSVGKKLGSDTTPWNDIYLKGSLKSQNGYTKLPNGMILQWGIANNESVSDYHVYFPLTFPSLCCSVTLTPMWSTTSSSANYDQLNNSSFALHKSFPTLWVSWIAIGF